MPSSSRSACLKAHKTAVTDKKEKPEHSKLLINDILCSRTGRYLITDFSGEGCFGKVAKGMNLITSQDVALKLLKSENTAAREIKMLELVSILDPVKKNMVRFFEQFKYKESTCLVFELLDRSLFQLFRERHWTPLSLSEIRPIAHQLLMALEALKSIGVIHADLKPDNIMLANHRSEPFRVKLIDFGLSFTTQNKTCGIRVQPLGYRAPEVTLGLPISEAIDMWGFGCVLGFLYLAKHLFATHCEYQSFKGIIDIVGQPADHLLYSGSHTHRYFMVNQHQNKQRWQIKTPKEFGLVTSIEPKRWISPLRSLDDLITHKPEMQKSTELEDQRAFASLLRSLLLTDPEKRITPDKALSHPFVKMAHLVNQRDTSMYVKGSLRRMLVCQINNLDKALFPHGLSGLCRVTDHLYLSNARAARDPAEVGRHQISCVINVTETGGRCPAPPGVEYVHLPVPDSPLSPLGDHFDEVADKIERTAERGGRTLVHCNAGVSRSAALCLAYLVKHRGLSLLEAHGCVRSCRPMARPNNGFWRQLIRYEMQIRGENSVHMSASSMGEIPDIYEEESRHMVPV